jgi:hypothetical protein
MLRVDSHSIAAKTDRKIAGLVADGSESIGRRREEEHKGKLSPLSVWK